MNALAEASQGRRVAGRVAGGLAWFLHHATWRMRLLEYAWPLVEKELASTVVVPWHVRPRMWRRGFLGEAWILYDFRRYHWRSYLSDHARFARTRLINGSAAVLLDDKAVFHRFVGSQTDRLPAIHGIVRRGAIETGEGKVPLCRTGEWLAARTWRDGALVIKPCTGGGGKGVLLLRASGRDISVNGEPTDEEGLRQVVSGADGCMVSQHVTQHPEIARLYQPTTNTVRVLTMQDEEAEPFVAAAVLRVGSRSSEPTDNWTRGGFSAGVCAETGRIGPAAAYPAGRRTLAWHEAHPDSGARIAGTTVPNWSGIVEGLTALMRALPMLRYVGWDVVPTPDGFRILEGNNFSDVNLLQIHGPLLADHRVADFYRRHGVLARR